MHSLDFLEPYASAPCAACASREKELEAMSPPWQGYSFRLAHYLRGMRSDGTRTVRPSWETTPSVSHLSTLEASPQPPFHLRGFLQLNGVLPAAGRRTYAAGLPVEAQPLSQEPYSTTFPTTSPPASMSSISTNAPRHPWLLGGISKILTFFIFPSLRPDFVFVFRLPAAIQSSALHTSENSIAAGNL